MKLQLERRATDDLIPYEANSKRHGEEDITAIMRSIERFGFNDPIAVTPDGIIIEGHGRWTACQRLGHEEVTVLVIEGLTEDQYDAYRIAHNKIALTSTFNFSELFGALQELVGEDNGIVFADMGFSNKMVGDLFNHFGDNENEMDGAPSSSGISVAASTASIEYDVIWDSAEDKAVFAKFMADEITNGGDKTMGGEVFLNAIAERDPDLWAQVVAVYPDEGNTLDHIAGNTEPERQYVAA